MLARIRKAEENDKGFTLIELLVVVIIIGILSAIAIPTFLKQREKGWDKAARADLRNNALKMEEYLDDKGVYPTTTTVNAADGGLYKFKQSENVSATTVKATEETAAGFCLDIASTKIKATGSEVKNEEGFRLYKFDSAKGVAELGKC